MTAPGKGHSWRDYAMLVGLGAGWGMTQPLGKIAASTGHGAFGLIFWQLVTVAVVLGSLSLIRGRRLTFHPAALRFYVTVAMLGTVIPNFTFYTSVARLPSGIMSIIISTIPLIALPLNVALGMERFDLRRMAGIGLGLVAVMMIVLPRAALPDRAMLAFLPVAMVGPVCYALENTYVARSGLAAMEPIEAMLGTTIVSLLLVGPLMLVMGHGYMPGLARDDLALIGSSALHGLLYATFVWLAARTGAVFASQSSYVTTLSGVTWAMLLLGERFSPWVLAAVAVLFAGMTLVRPRVAQAGSPGDRQKLA